MIAAIMFFFFGLCFVACCVWGMWAVVDHIFDMKKKDNAIPLFVKVLGPGAIAFFCLTIANIAWESWRHPDVVAARQHQIDVATAAADAPHLIYQKDGCDVYRFSDHGLYHYFTRCPNAAVTTVGEHNVTTSHLCGPHGIQCSETHVVQEDIQTNTGANK